MGGNEVVAPTGEQAKSESMNVYGSGDQFGSENLPKGAEIMRRRSEPGRHNDSKE